MRVVRLLLFFVVGLFLGGASVAAFAQSVWTGVRTSPGSIYLKGPNKLPFNVDTGKYVSSSAGSPPSGATLNGSYSATVGTALVVIESAAQIGPRPLAKLATKVMKASGPAIAAGLLLDLALDWNEDDQEWRLPGTPYVEGKEWKVLHNAGSQSWHPSPEAACTAYAPLVTVGYAGNRGTVALNSGGTPFCIVEGFLNGQWWWVRNESFTTQVYGGPAPVGEVATSQQIEDAVYVELVARGMGSELARRLVEHGYVPGPSVSEIEEDAVYVELVARGMSSDLARRLVSAGYIPDMLPGLSDPKVLSGPSSVPGDTTTKSTQTPQGTTTVISQETHNLTYNGDTVTITTTTTETTTHPDGSQTTSTTTTVPSNQPQQQEPQYSLDFTVPEFPPVPDFYEQKFPDGFSGAWQARRAELEQTSLFSLVTAFTSGAPSSGVCPSWSFNLNMPGVVALGTHDLAPPCVVWPFIKAVMIITALFVARRLVFGG